MAITKPTKKKTAAEFISGAPDAVKDDAGPRYVRKGKKLQITLTIAQPLLEQVDGLAEKLSLSRAAVINLAIHQGMVHGISVDGSRRD